MPNARALSLSLFLSPLGTDRSFSLFISISLARKIIGHTEYAFKLLNAVKYTA